MSGRELANQDLLELEAGRKELSVFRDFVTDEMVPSEERDTSFERSAGSVYNLVLVAWLKPKILIVYVYCWAVGFLADLKHRPQGQEL